MPAAGLVRTAAAGPLALHVVDRSGRGLLVAGEYVECFVDINVPRVLKRQIDAIEINLAGLVTSRISRDTSINSHTVWETKNPLFRHSERVWTASSASPTTSGLERVHFRAQLPQDLPPSHRVGHVGTFAAVVYGVEVSGLREGQSKPSCRVHLPFAVYPQISPMDVDVDGTLGQSLTESSKSVKFKRLVRRGIWGRHSTVHAEIVLPDVHSFPTTTTSAPFRLKITTRTKPIKTVCGRAPKVPITLFPAPPTDPSAITMRLVQETHWIAGSTITAENWSAETVTRNLAGFGKSRSGTPGSISITIDEPQWVPAAGTGNEEGKLVYERSVTFDAAMSFKCTPSFETERVTLKHYIYIRVPVAGFRNILDCYAPIKISSRARCPPPAPPPPADTAWLSPTDNLPSLQDLLTTETVPTYDDTVHLNLPRLYWATKSTT
ncbi:hypothetical protein PUNSTDRAFT_145159 [Punctularia strigosozonata HHB-11173 SS5]|uniref:uncharacterized protein n=1 Tax=Punctularia strigosozonata (strain HHB-11173) TaxID=741275 RepID=UPI00044164C3|nr:uncharacterized protein PUNSTDRAFT_145159 [Punctularia strigosozonata HHB-11173 SS5]EIN06606.1 hypothetical protein PUNSTDRAFT_145159 [Punctularia strigosozonata HHB-11173 SS5]